MKLIIAGSRTFKNYELLKKECDDFIGDYFGEVIIVSGHAKGADLHGEHYARMKGYEAAIFPADWDKFGNSAGAIRNKQMAEYATHCICFWDGVSRGKKDMIKQAKAKGLPLRIIQYTESEKSV